MKKCLINNKSVIYNLPLEISRRDLLIIDSIRFSIELIELNYNNLIEELEKVMVYHSNGNSNYSKNLICMFNSAWGIIDHTNRFYKLKKLLSPMKDDFFYEGERILSKFRNTFQHLQDRIDECLTELESPFYGSLSWGYKPEKSTNTQKYYAITGLVIPQKEKIKIEKSEDVIPINIITNIKIETFIKDDNKTFIKESVNITKLINSIEKIIIEFEKDLETIFNDTKLTQRDWVSRRDIIIMIDVK